MLRTDEYRKQQAMVFPASAQLVSVEEREDGVPVASCVGAPDVIDLVGFAPWESWRCRTYAWQRCEASGSCGFALKDMQRVELQQLEWRDPACRRSQLWTAWPATGGSVDSHQVSTRWIP